MGLKSAWNAGFGQYSGAKRLIFEVVRGLSERMAFSMNRLGRVLAAGFFIVGLALSGTSVPAKAAYIPPYAEMVIDARTGRVLYALNPDSLRHPASLTKVMTLYMLFEALESGKVTMNTDLKVSARAQRQAPSKLGLNAGDTIKVEDAIKALVTKSANDVAVTVAENLGGSEDEFANLMTRKAQSLGMKRTVYANASGLPNPKQLTTARDLITLGQAIQKRFPKYFAYFSMRSFEYDGNEIPTHNKLLGKVEGVDGIKTGYTQKSGFNLLTSVHTDDKALIAVILGGRSGRARDNRMADLIETYLPSAATSTQGTKVAKLPPVKAPKLDTADKDPSTENEDVAEAPANDTPKAKAAPAPKPIVTAEPAPVATQSAAAEAPQPKAPRIQPMAAQAAEPAPQATNSTSMFAPPVQPNGLAMSPNGLKLAWQTGAQPVDPNTTGSKRPAATNSIYLQIGTAQTETDAKRLLSSARDKGGAQLSAADMQTDQVKVNGKTLWRARFGLNDESIAHDVCKTLKKNKMACFVSRG